MLGVCQRRLQMLCRPRESIRPGSSWKSECCGSQVLAGASYWPSSHCIPAQKFVSVSGKLNHDRSPLVLNSDKGVCCHRSFSQSPLHELDRRSQLSRRGCHSWELQDQPLIFCRRFGTASIFSTEYAACTRSVFCCVRPSQNENQH